MGNVVISCLSGGTTVTITNPTGFPLDLKEDGSIYPVDPYGTPQIWSVSNAYGTTIQSRQTYVVSFAYQRPNPVPLGAEYVMHWYQGQYDAQHFLGATTIICSEGQ
jgi:hypothetical protein